MGEYCIHIPEGLSNNEILKIRLKTRRIGFEWVETEEDGTPRYILVDLEEEYIKPMREAGWIVEDPPPCDCGYCDDCVKRKLDDLYEQMTENDKKLFDEMKQYERKIIDCYMSMSLEGQTFVNAKCSSPAPSAGICCP